ncbi:hypothetical protein JCM19046_4894 [Bacillus sp. JCM 19046]|nr:hypothetical protein JCM19045_14 [Bacillus sp. JCM 19045]GAF20188.1 hypothetical protein JCM19046_4894 [Bacillus sp. JCM 19046]
MKKLNIKEIYILVDEFFGHKLTSRSLNLDDNELQIVLYDSFVFEFSVDERYAVFGAGLKLLDGQLLLSIFGESLAINNDKKSIIGTFEKADRYCRFRLTDKFLTKYDEVYRV